MDTELELLDEIKKVVYRVDADSIEKIKILAAKKRTTQNNLFIEALNDLFNKYKDLLK